MFNDARDVLLKKSADETARIKTISPATSLEVENALEDSARAQEKAANLMGEHRAMVEDLEDGLESLAHLRQRISRVRACMLTPEDEKLIAEQAIEFLLLHAESPCISNLSGYESRLKTLLAHRAFAPHLAGVIKKLEFRATKLEAEIRSTSETQQVAVKKLLRSSSRLQKLLDAGLLADF